MVPAAQCSAEATTVSLLLVWREATSEFPFPRSGTSACVSHSCAGTAPAQWLAAGTLQLAERKFVAQPRQSKSVGIFSKVSFSTAIALSFLIFWK